MCVWGGQTPGRRPRQAAGKCSGSGCEAGERERPCAAAGGGRGDGRAAIAGDPGVSGGGEGGRRPCGRVVDENPRLCSIAGPVESAGCVYLIYRTGGCQCPPPPLPRRLLKRPSAPRPCGRSLQGRGDSVGAVPATDLLAVAPPRPGTTRSLPHRDPDPSPAGRARARSAARASESRAALFVLNRPA